MVKASRHLQPRSGFTMSRTTTSITDLPPRHLHGAPNHRPTSLFTQRTALDLLNKGSTSVRRLKQAHAITLLTGHIQDHYVSGTLVKLYANPTFKELDSALKVFACVPKPNVFVWNAVLKACLENDEPLEALLLYCNMVGVDSWPNIFTFPTVLKACNAARAVEEGVQVHAQIVKRGFQRDLHVKSSAIQMYASFGSLVDARKVLDENSESDVVCWNTMVDGYLRCGDIEAAGQLFDEMPERNIGSWNAMVTGLARCGMINKARNAFNSMNQKDEISWSAMIDGYIKAGRFKEAVDVFIEMQRENLKPKKFILSSVLAACANFGALDQGIWVHNYVKRKSIRVDAILGTSLIDMYAKCGRLDMAWKVFDDTHDKETFTWNAMIGGLAIHGLAHDAIELFHKMINEKSKPDAITFVNLLTACAHTGMVDKGMEILNSMERLYGIEPKVEHYGSVVDLLGRAGELAKAEELIRSMPMEPNAAVLGALLGACKIHGNAELGERIGTILLGLEPENGGRYSLLSNIYAKAGKFNQVSELRKLMKERGVRTETGCSMIELGGVVHEFKIGDGSHPRSKEIYSSLETMIQRLQEEGYSPDTSQVLFDIDEEEKEKTVRYHSEKIAIAFGIISTEPGTAIRVIKNLRMCEDCHSAAKLISKVYTREIIVRDRVRYHSFKDGNCSCRDFW